MEPTIGVLYVHAAGVAGPLLSRLKTADERLAVYRRQTSRNDGGPGVDCILLDAPDGTHVQRGVETARAAYNDIPVVVRTRVDVDTPSNTADAVLALAEGADIDELVATLIETASETLVPDEVVLRDEILQSVPMGVSIADSSRPDLPLVYVNGHFESLTGYPQHEILGRNCRFLQGEGTREEPVKQMSEAIEAGESVIVELRNYRRDGTEFWNRVKLIPVTTIDGEVTNYLGFQRDISADNWREQGENRVREHRSKLFDRLERTDEDLSIEALLSHGRQALALSGASVTAWDAQSESWEDITRDDDHVIDGEQHDDLEDFHTQVLEERDCWGVTDRKTAQEVLGDEHPEVGCYIGSPVFLDGAIYGIVSFVGGSSRNADFSETERTFTTLVATLVGRTLERRGDRPS